MPCIRLFLCDNINYPTDVFRFITAIYFALFKATGTYGNDATIAFMFSQNKPRKYAGLFRFAYCFPYYFDYFAHHHFSCLVFISFIRASCYLNSCKYKRVITPMNSYTMDVYSNAVVCVTFSANSGVSFFDVSSKSEVHLLCSKMGKRKRHYK